MEMNYIKFGTGDKTMLILPGLSLTPVCDNPEPVIKAYQMFTEEFTVYLFDIRSDVQEAYSISDMAKDTVEKINELGLKDIYLFGVSLGGMTSLEIVINYPGLVKKLVLASTTSKFVCENVYEWIDLAKQNKTLELADAFCKAIYTDNFYRQIKPVLPMYYSDVDPKLVHNFEIYANALTAFDVSDDLDRIDIPVLILGSKKDKVIANDELMYLNQNIKDSEIYLYDDYSHAVYDEAPDFKDRIIAFFGR